MTMQTRNVDRSTRDQLFSRIWDLVLREGFTSLTMDDLSARLHCSKATLYVIAQTKDTLIMDVFEQFFEGIDTGIDVNLSGVTDSAERITVYLASIGTAMRQMSQICYYDMVTHVPTREIYLTHVRRRTHWLRETLGEGMESGIFRQAHVTFVTEAVNLVGDAIERGDLSTRTGLPPEAAYRELGIFIVAGLTNTSYRRSNSFGEPSRIG